MNRSRLIAIALFSSILCLGATAADGFTYGDQGESQDRLDRPSAADLDTRNRLGSGEYDVQYDIVPDAGTGGGPEQCSDGGLRSRGSKLTRVLQSIAGWFQVAPVLSDPCDEADQGGDTVGGDAIQFEVSL